MRARLPRGVGAIEDAGLGVLRLASWTAASIASPISTSVIESPAIEGAPDGILAARGRPVSTDRLRVAPVAIEPNTGHHDLPKYRYLVSAPGVNRTPDLQIRSWLGLNHERSLEITKTHMATVFLVLLQALQVIGCNLLSSQGGAQNWARLVSAFRWLAP